MLSLCTHLVFIALNARAPPVKGIMPICRWKGQGPERLRYPLKVTRRYWVAGLQSLWSVAPHWAPWSKRQPIRRGAGIAYIGMDVLKPRNKQIVISNLYRLEKLSASRLVGSLGARASLPGIKSLCFPTMCLWGGLGGTPFICLLLSFLICKTKIVTLSSSQGDQNSKRNQYSSSTLRVCESKINI